MESDEIYLSNLPEGWFASSRQDADRLHRELQIELPPGHVLYAKAVDVIAHREGTDDVLCRHLRENDRFTVVHLTWRMHEEINVNFPSIEVDGTFGDFLCYEKRFSKL